MVFGGRTDHGRAADIDILDAGVVIGAGGDGCLKGIEVHYDQIDRIDVVLLHRRQMSRLAFAEYAAMHFRMQCLYATVQDFGETGMVADLDHRDIGIAQLARFAGDGSHPAILQEPGEIHQARFTETDIRPAGWRAS